LSPPPSRSERARRPVWLRCLRAAARLAILLVVILAVISVSSCCDRLFYYPDHIEHSDPAQQGVRFERVTFTSEDGTRLSGWFFPAAGPAKGTIVHCHGNAQNITSHWRGGDFLPERGFHLLVFDYRGYGASDGSPTRRGTVMDARAAVAYVRGRPDVDPRRVALFGQSLGGAVAVVVAAGDPRIKGAVIDSAFTSYQAEAAHVLRRTVLLYPLAWPLSRLLVSSGLDPIDCVDRISPRPLLFVHGTRDRVVPPEMSRELAARAKEPKQLWLAEGATHIAALFQQRQDYVRTVGGFFDKVFAAE